MHLVAIVCFVKRHLFGLLINARDKCILFYLVIIGRFVLVIMPSLTAKLLPALKFTSRNCIVPLAYKHDAGYNKDE